MLFPNITKKNLSSKAAVVCKKKFIYYFKKGYQDQKYIDWERQYKVNAHLQFAELLNKAAYSKLLEQHAWEKIAGIVARIESKTNLLFSFEKMAFHDAIKSAAGARAFAMGLYDYVYGTTTLKDRFEKFVDVIASLPRKQTRVLTWPVVTVFGFIANPGEHIFLKPRVTQIAANKYGYPFEYSAAPNWNTYQSLLNFARQVWKDTADLKPRDLIDIQSFIWVMGSEEYPD